MIHVCLATVSDVVLQQMLIGIRAELDDLLVDEKSVQTELIHRHGLNQIAFNLE